MTLARVLAGSALAQGLNVRVGETLGMAQRGGSVQSHVRIGENIHSPLMPRGKCSVLLSLERSEAVRVPEYLSPDTKAIVATTAVFPIPVLLGEAKYPELSAITEALNRISCKVYTLQAAELAREANAPTSLNMVVLGAYDALNENVLETKSIRAALHEALPNRFIAPNTRAFDKGYEAMKALR